MRASHDEELTSCPRCKALGADNLRAQRDRALEAIKAVTAVLDAVERDDPKTIKAVHVSRIRAALAGVDRPPAAPAEARHAWIPPLGGGYNCGAFISSSEQGVRRCNVIWFDYTVHLREPSAGSGAGSDNSGSDTDG